eukprot:gnl/Dysnectes_brevis/2705_a3281_1195.p1 GENE.gnl/Dysnectes_brevis/2705_a3281_1195~~gnl/Dysnectes_brevis/2705_a3281_1195.p1  ORF type:complete len:340 (-),score=69.08 gnl/Dysnectes_brevis/2705_a3281_1195:222-1241(-)
MFELKSIRATDLADEIPASRRTETFSKLDETHTCLELLSDDHPPPVIIEDEDLSLTLDTDDEEPSSLPKNYRPKNISFSEYYGALWFSDLEATTRTTVSIILYCITVVIHYLTQKKIDIESQDIESVLKPIHFTQYTVWIIIFAGLLLFIVFQSKKSTRTSQYVMLWVTYILNITYRLSMAAGALPVATAACVLLTVVIFSLLTSLQRHGARAIARASAANYGAWMLTPTTELIGLQLNDALNLKTLTEHPTYPIALLIMLFVVTVVLSVRFKSFIIPATTWYSFVGVLIANWDEMGHPVWNATRILVGLSFAFTIVMAVATHLGESVRRAIEGGEDWS